MNKEKKRLLIVDDEKPLLDALVRAFSVAQHFEYEITALLDLKEVVNQEVEDAEFDICVIDLGFGRERDLLGFMALFSRSELNRADMRIVYSGHPKIKNVVRAMQLGATDFVSKAEYPPHKLVERVESMLIERQEREERTQRIYKFLGEHHNDLSNLPPGQVLAITVAEAGPMVAAEGRSRLDALLKYADWRRNQSNAQLPVVPHLHIVPPKSSQ